MKSTRAIARAIDQYLASSGRTARELAHDLDVHESSVSSWKSGRSNIANRHWQQLVSLIAEFLPEDEQPRHEVMPATRDDLGYSVPVIGFAKAADYEASLESIEDFVEANSEDLTVSFPQARPGDVGIIIRGDSMCPWYPPGTVVLVRPGEFPQRGDIVVAKLHTGAVVCKRYSRRQGVVMLEALNHGSEGESFEWNIKEQPGFVLWMWPVLASLRDERAVRWQASRLGVH